MSIAISISNSVRGSLVPGGGVTPFTNTYSMSFDGVDEYFNGASTFSELDGLKKFTLSMWVKPTSFATSRILFHIPRNTTASHSQILLRYATNGNLDFTIDTSSYYIRTGTPLTLDVWNHILVCVDLTNPTGSQRGRIYINSIDVTSLLNINSRTAFSTSTGAIWLGEEANGYINPFLGNMDEVAMWVGSDERANIADIYNGGVPFDLSTLATAPDHWWRMGDGDTWSGSSWTLSDNIGSYDLNSVNMEEADRLPISPNSYTQNSFSFDGVDEYFEIGSPTSIQNLTSEITISFWIKAPKVFSQNYYTALSKGEYAAGGSQWSVRINTANDSNTIGGYFQVFPNSNAITDNQSVAFPTAIDNNQWHHLMCVNDGTDLKIYLDGQLEATGLGKGRTLYNGNRSLKLGRLTASASVGLLQGNLDEVAIFGTALGLTEAQTIFNNGVPQDISSLSPVSHWRMGENATWNGSTWTLTDQGSGGNNATSVNMEEADKTGDQAYVI